jgi:hypothetical protein
MRWWGQVTCIKEMRNTYTVFARNMKGRDNLEDLGVDVRIILKFILRKILSENNF